MHSATRHAAMQRRRWAYFSRDALKLLTETSDILLLMGMRKSLYSLVFALFSSAAAFAEIPLLEIAVRNSSGAQSNLMPENAKISGDARIVLFSSASTNLTSPPPDARYAHIFSLDRWTGKTILLFDQPRFDPLGGEDWSELTLSANGRVAAFLGRNPDKNSFNFNTQLILADTSSGSLEVVTDSQVRTGWYPPLDANEAPALNADGSLVAFSCQDPAIVGADAPYPSLVIYDRMRHEFRVLRRGTDVELVTQVSLSANGKYAAFLLYDGTGDTSPPQKKIMLLEVASGSEVLVNRPLDGSFPYSSSLSGLSSDGRYVLFESDHPNMVEGDTNDNTDCFLFDRTTGKARRVTLGADGRESPAGGGHCALGDDGKWVVFRRSGEPYYDESPDKTQGLYRLNLESGALDLVSVSKVKGNAPGEQTGDKPCLSADGSSVLFRTSTRLVKTDVTRMGVMNDTDLYLAQFGRAPLPPLVTLRKKKLFLSLPNKRKGEVEFVVRMLTSAGVRIIARARTKTGSVSLPCTRAGTYEASYSSYSGQGFRQSKERTFRIKGACNFLK